ncbi:MAG TPA: virulence protein [Clostridia bacterium]|nr:virulence protein [Clostridia bacterium]
MQIKYHLEGSERKALLAVMREILQDTPKYMGPPTFSFEIGPYTIDRHGTLDCPDYLDSKQVAMLICELERDGFIGERICWPAKPIERKAAEMPKQEIVTPTLDGLDRLSVEMPRDDMTPTAMENLRRLVASKATLLKKALGTDSLPMTEHSDRIEFGWFRLTDDQAELAAYYQLVQGLCELARTQKRVSASEQEVENEKYAFRCFLLRLGFIGQNYKDSRRVLLKRLTGNAAFRDAREAGDQA